MLGGNFQAGKILCGNRQQFGGGRNRAAHAVQHALRRQAGKLRQLTRRCARRQRQNPLEHVDIKSRQRQRRPGRTGTDMEQHDPALALLPRRHQRRAVTQPRPAVVRQSGAGLGQNLLRHRHFIRHHQTVEGAGGREGRQLLRLVPGHGAAQQPSAGAQRHGNQGISAAGHARPGKAHQHAAIGNKFVHRIGIAAADLADIRQQQHGRMARNQFGYRAGLCFRERRQRPLQIIDIRQKRLLIFSGRGRDDARPALHPARIQQLHRACAILAANFQPRCLVADFQRHGDMALAARLANRENQRRIAQCFAIAADGGGHDFTPRSARCPNCRQLKTGAVAHRRQQSQRAGLRRENPHTPDLRQRITEFRGLAVINAVAQPENLRPCCEVGVRQAGRRRHAVAGPGHRLYFVRLPSGSARIQQSDGRIRIGL